MKLPLFCTKLLIRTRIARYLPSFRRSSHGASDYLHYFADRVLSAPLDAMLDEGAFPDIQTPDTIHLAMSSPRFDSLTAGIVRSVVMPRQSVPPQGMTELRMEIAHQHAHAHQVSVDAADEVLITHGATGAFGTILDTFVNPGTNVCVFDPTSPMFTIGLKSRRARILTVPTWMEEGRTRFHLGPFVKAMKGAKLLVLADPSNPTGGCLAPEDLEQIAWWARHYDVLIYLDESLSRFRYDEQSNHLPKLPDASNRVIVGNSISKGHGLSSLRVGWLVGHRHLIRACSVTSALTNPFVPIPCQQMALAAMRTVNDEAFDTLRQGFASRRRYVYERLTSMGLQPAWPSGGFFFWVPVSPLGKTGREFAQSLLEEKRVLVGPGDVFGASGSKFIRISYAIEEGRLREGLSRIGEYVNELRRVPDMPRQPELVKAA